MNAVDAGLMGRLLLRVEADAHRRGWDESPAVFVLYDSRDIDTDRVYRSLMAGRRGPATRCGPYAAQSMVPPSALDGFSSHGLFRMALNLDGASDDPRVAPLVGALRQPGFLGMAFLVEAWSRETDDPQERKSWGGKRFADMPGSKETRMVTAVDVGGRCHIVRRVRGDKPVVHSSLGSDGDPNLGGAVVESLRMIVAVVADLPKPEMTTVPSMWSWDDQPRAEATP